MIDNNLAKTIQRLVEIGRGGNFDELADLSDLQDHDSVCRFAEQYRGKVALFVFRLPDDDRVAFVKSIAMLEDRVGGLGSTTILKRSPRLVSDNDRGLLDWILRNTKKHGWHKASSIEELDLMKARCLAHAEESAAKELERHLASKKRIAEISTHNLYNAVRRGDIRAVRSLLLKGANPSATSPAGTSMIDFASSQGHAAIVAELSESVKQQNDANE